MREGLRTLEVAQALNPCEPRSEATRMGNAYRISPDPNFKLLQLSI